MLLSCTACEGFVPTNASACPHCGAQSLDVKTSSKLGGIVRNIANVATGGAIAVTLMACYGGPPGTDYLEPGPDCSSGVLPGVDDPFGDGIDQNCDGVDGFDNGSSSSSSSSSGTSNCLTCLGAVQAGGLVPPVDGFCSADAETVFGALGTCACTDRCATVCGEGICKGVVPATVECSACIQDSCNQENLDCEAN